MLCWRGAACAVFRYDEFWSVLPDGLWRVQRGTLVAADSRWLAALGAVAPLWDDASGYVIMLATVAIPGVGLWLLRQPRSRAGQGLLALAVILAGFYALMWVYAVALLSHLLLHAVVLALLAGGGSLALLYWSALKSGMRTTTLLGSSSPDTCVPQSHTLAIRANPSPTDSLHFPRGDIFAYRDHRDRRAAGFTCVSGVSRCYGLTSNSPFVG